jgi:hypothetical protein
MISAFVLRPSNGLVARVALPGTASKMMHQHGLEQAAKCIHPAGCHPTQALPGWPHVMSTGRRQTLTGRSDGGGGPSAASSSGSNSGSGRLGAAMRAARRRAAGAQVLLLAQNQEWLGVL